jgi:hypothetical protein
MSAAQGGGGGLATDAGPAYDVRYFLTHYHSLPVTRNDLLTLSFQDSELPPDYAAVYGGDPSATDDVEDSTEEAGSADAQATSTAQPAPAGSSTSKFPDPYAPIPSRRIQSVHKSPLPLP